MDRVSEWATDSGHPARTVLKPASLPPRCCKSDRQPGFAARSERMGLEWLHTIRHRDLHPRHQPESSDYRDWRGYSPRTFTPKKQGPPFPSCGIFKKSEAFGV